MYKRLFLLLFLTACQNKTSVSVPAEYPYIEMNKLGQRLASCDGQEDWQKLTIPTDFDKQAIEKVKNSQLKQIPIKGSHCLRVGTEVELYSSELKHPFLGRAFITSIHYFAPGILDQYLNLSTWENSRLLDFDSQDPNQPTSLINIDHLIRVFPQKLTKQGERLPSCSMGYSDWTSWPLKEAEADEFMQNIADGKMKASVWNGVYNCYRIGRSVQIYIEDNDGWEDLGALVPKELHLTPIEELTEEQAKLVDKSLSELKEMLSEKKDRDGGYATIVVWEYQPPKDLQ